MPGNSSRRGAGHKGKGNTAGSGGRVRRGLEGKGPTPRAEDRPYHKAYKAKQAVRSTSGQSRQQARTGASTARKGSRLGAGPEWVIGRNPVLEALAAGLPVKKAFVAEGADRDDRLRDILKYAADHSLPLLQVTRPELDRLTDGTIHQGVALQLPAYEYLHPDDLLADAVNDETKDALVVACDQVTDPRNLGAIIRSAAAFGAHGVVIPERRNAGMTAAAWKSSAGAAARLPVARATNLNRALETYAKAGFTIVGLAGESDTDIASIDATGALVVVVGSEGEGLSRLVREHCDVLVSIPIASEVESLNASVATSIALYELTRLRRRHDDD